MDVGMDTGADSMDTGADPMDTGEGGTEMVLPALAVGLIASGTFASGVYHVGKAVEQRKYWNDYRNRTGYTPRYPFRRGYYDYLGATGRMSSSLAGSYGAYWGNRYYRWYK